MKEPRRLVSSATGGVAGGSPDQRKTPNASAYGVSDNMGIHTLFLTNNKTVPVLCD